MQAYGHLRDYLAQLDPLTAPPRIMLHSYGGSPDMVKSFTALGQQHAQRSRSKTQSQPQGHTGGASEHASEQNYSSKRSHGTGEQGETSSPAVCGSEECGGKVVSIGERMFFSFSAVLCSKSSKKAAERVAAVPDDRILLETDLTEIEGMNERLLEIAEFVAEAKGWTVEHTVEQTWRNFQAFYDWNELDTLS